MWKQKAGKPEFSLTVTYTEITYSQLYIHIELFKARAPTIIKMFSVYRQIKV